MHSSSFIPHLSSLVQYLAARIAAAALTSCDVDLNLRSAAALGRCLYRFDKRHRQRALGHLQIAFPHLSTQQRDDLARRSFEYFVQLVVEVCHTPRLIHLSLIDI